MELGVLVDVPLGVLVTAVGVLLAWLAEA